MAGRPTINASRVALAMVALGVACGGGGGWLCRGSGHLGPSTVSAQQWADSRGVLGEPEERTENGLAEPPPAAVVVEQALVAHSAEVDGVVQDSVDLVHRSGVKEGRQEAGKEAASDQQQPQRQPRQEETTNRLPAYVARRRKPEKLSRRRQGGREASSSESPAGAALLSGNSINVDSIRKHHYGRVEGEALEHATWPSDRCWLDKGDQSRCQANVFLFGVSKCGTSSLAAWMAHHPTLRWVSNMKQIGAPGNEAHVLDEMGAADFNEMLREGTAGKYGKTAPAASETDKVIDYTPHSSIKAEVPYRILDIYGDAARNGSTKYIVTLRDPVARAISSWQSKFDVKVLTEEYDEEEQAKHSSETRFFADAIRQGEDGVVAHQRCREMQRQLAGGFWNFELKREVDLERCRLRDFMGATHYLYWAHVAKGIYTMQLERWFSLLGRENVKVMFLEETAANPVEALSEVFEFIGLDLVDEEGRKGLPSRKDWEDVVSVIHNETEEARKRVLGWQVTPDLVRSMQNFFAPFNAQLQELLGRPLPENWLLPASPQ